MMRMVATMTRAIEGIRTKGATSVMNGRTYIVANQSRPSPTEELREQTQGRHLSLLLRLQKRK